jgi:hypothetical protein
MKQEARQNRYNSLTGDSIEIVVNKKTDPATGKKTDEPATHIPPDVLLSMFYSGAIPLLEAPPTDERRWCRHAINGDPAGGATCRELRDGGAWCALNGIEAREPCVFSEPDDAPIWAAIREYRADRAARGLK